MLVDIKSMIRQLGAMLTIETETGPEELSCAFQGYRLTRPLVFRGTLRHSGEGVLQLDGRILTAYAGECARCLANVDVTVDLAVSEVYKPHAAASDNEEDDSYRYEGMVLDISQAIRDNLVLAMPPRLYCRDDCRGLCTVCGADLNEHDCGHGGQPDAISGFDRLKDLL